MQKKFAHVRMLLIDNYDSFTYNLVQAFAAMGANVMVYRNDAITVEEALELKPTHLVISPGPGRPEDAGISLAMIEAFAGKVPILGVCLGHQSIVQQHGGKIVRADRLMHGKTSMVKPVRGGTLSFTGCRRGNAAGRAAHNGSNRARRDHGRAPQDTANRRSPVSSRERADARG